MNERGIATKRKTIAAIGELKIGVLIRYYGNTWLIINMTDANLQSLEKIETLREK